MTGKDIAHALKMGASGVQMGTRFVASNECDTPLSFKEKYINARLEDTILVKTTIGLQSRAVKNNFTKLIADNNKKMKIKRCINGLKNCSYRFCTLDFLIISMDGDCKNGLVFAGARVNEVKEILPVQTIINNIMMEYRACI